jgi:integrase
MYLERRYRKYLAFHAIPEDVQQALGKKRFAASLDTDNLAVAKQRGAVLEAQWRGLIEQARGKAQATDPILERGLWWRQGWKPEHAEALEMEANDMEIAGAMRRGIYDYSDPRFEEVPERKDAQRLRGIATGKLIPTDTRLDEYLAQLDNEPKTIFMKGSTIRAFAREFHHISDIRRSAVQQWVNRQIQAGRARATINRAISEMRGYWKYLQDAEVVDEDHDPFDGLQKRKASKNAKRDERRAFTATDVVALHKAALEIQDQPLADLIELAVWTGARREELCALKVGNVHATSGYIEIEDAKTDAGWRQVPIHSALKATVTRLVKASRDGFLLSGLGANKYGKRGGGIGGRFARLRTVHGFGAQHVFHSIRRTVTTTLRAAGVDRDVINDILGWEGRGMQDHYSEVAPLAVKREAIEKLAYPGW